MSQTYFQLQMQSKRQLAIDLTNSLRSIHGNLISTINSAKMGTQRLINYGSCVIPDEYYRSACRDMMREDERLLLAVGEIFNRQDVTVDMVSIYFKKTLKIIDNNKANDLVSFLHEKLGFAANKAAGKVSNMSLAITIAKLIISSGNFKETHINMVNKFASWFISGASIYGNAQLAASAANKLKFQDSEYYNLLYKENLEMLYFTIEPFMTKIIYQIESGDNRPEIIADALYEILKK
ncbi:hypothetical protein [Citrobacter sp. R56]|uniref:hypothetical protein n=1 Tax=Citrobacter sp. R56 TaxID=1573676 RepID=UPI00193C3E35|nr:hypothetical protein [Citrobacter sp. R56]QRG77271.1 hypothetical protein JM656_11545 [Citrobacter sp. R56]